MKRLVYSLLLFISFSCLADIVNRSDSEMRNASKEGREAGLSSQNNSFNTNMAEFSGYQSRPQQSSFYKGITATSTDLNQKGNDAFQNSEIKSVLEDSIKNNPRDDIKWDSEIIQNGLRIKDSADAIVGGTGNQCVKQVVNKSSFENFYCEKDNNVEAVCTNTAEVKWVDHIVEERTQVLIPANMIRYNQIKKREGFWVSTRELEVSFNIPKTGKVVSYTIYSAYSGNGMSILYENYVILPLFNHKLSNYSSEKTDGLGYPNIGILPSPIQVYAGQEIKTKFETPMRSIWQYLINSGAALNHLKNGTIRLAIKLDILETVHTKKPEIEWKYNCPIDKGNAIKTEEYCSQAGGTRNFPYDGHNYPITLDCWQKSEKWLMNDVSDNECRSLEQKPNCTVGKRECISSLGNTCLRFGITYQCQNIQKQEGYLCGGRFYCDDGSCAGLTRNTNKDFGQAVSQLAALYKAGKDFALNNGSLRAFSGKTLMCRKTGFGFSNCCKDSGWGQSLGIAHCNSEEKELGVAKEKKLAIYVGTFCDKKVLGVCIRKKSSYCAFDNKLARIIQLQGRAGQLHIGFGSAESPDCRGLTVEELQSIKFDNINYSDFFDELDNNKRIPDNNVILDYMKGSIKDKFGK
ncbi:TPA: conjugal transfer protein TraN [Pasteurella multocida]|nr:conjugal transfer protein TraN [Pasteurella multocida]